MFKAIRVIFPLFLSVLCLSCATTTTSTSAPTDFHVLVFSDVHFNPFDDPKLFPALVATDISSWPAIFKGTANPLPSGWGQDANYPLLVLALASMKANGADSKVVVFTGDVLAHQFSTQYYQYCGCQDQEAMQSFADKTVAFFMTQVRSSVGHGLVVFAVGNNDSYGAYGPDTTFLSANAESYYSLMLNSTPNHQDFLNSFTAGGYYSVNLQGKKVKVIGLNTILFSPLLQTDTTSQVAAELEWLDAELASAKNEGDKVWLLMHAPPGIQMGATSAVYSAGGQLQSMAMMWKPEFQTAFFATLAKYPGRVTLTLAGHTHVDEFRVVSTDSVVMVTPSIAPSFGNNPAYKILTLSDITLGATDSRWLHYDLSSMSGQFEDYYVFSKAYPMSGGLSSSLVALQPTLVTDTARQEFYRNHFYSGHNAMTPDPNPITDANWPLYSCGIDKMVESDFVNCVNKY